MYSGTCAIFIPLFADQFRNAELARTRGTGEVVPKSELSGARLAELVEQLLSNRRFACARALDDCLPTQIGAQNFSYANAAAVYQRLLRAKPFKARELITRWNRFLLEHHVDLNVRSLGVVQQFSLDVIVPLVLTLAALLALIAYFIYRVLKLYYWSCFVMGKERAVGHKKRE